MKIKTFSIVAGSMACNGRCPFCVAGMTPSLGINLKEPEINWRNFDIACKLARQSGVTTAMITSKGEPTLFPRQVTKFLEHMRPYNFPLIEIQTNGIMLAEKRDNFKEHLQDWHKLGMTTIAISIVHYEPEMNRQVYLPYKQEYIDLPELVRFLHCLGFSVRLTCVAVRNFIDNVEKLNNLVNFAKLNRVEQLTLTPVNKTDHAEHEDIRKWVDEHYLLPEQFNSIKHYLADNGAMLLKLNHGTIVYDLYGQNICLSNCLTVQPEAEEMRNLIFFPDGHLRYNWQYPGAILL